MSNISDALGIQENQIFRLRGHDNYYCVSGEILLQVGDLDNPNHWLEAFPQELYPLIVFRENLEVVDFKKEREETQINAIKGKIAEGYLWLARDYSGRLTAFTERPERDEKKRIFYTKNYDDMLNIRNKRVESLYDFVKYNNSPVFLPDILYEKFDI